jgi:hypothetical protein
MCKKIAGSEAPAGNAVEDLQAGECDKPRMRVNRYTAAALPGGGAASGQRLKRPRDLRTDSPLTATLQDGPPIL